MPVLRGAAWAAMSDLAVRRQADALLHALGAGVTVRVRRASPLCPATGWRHASAPEIVGHWRKVGRRGAGPDDGLDMLDVVSKEQLSLPGSHT